MKSRLQQRSTAAFDVYSRKLASPVSAHKQPVACSAPTAENEPAAGKLVSTGDFKKVGLRLANSFATDPHDEPSWTQRIDVEDLQPFEL